MRAAIPPLLPPQWSGAYVSYWFPMLPDDQISSGFCWFDYTRNLCRIDGLFNPWPERETGYRLWMSEIGDATHGRSHKRKVAYSRERTPEGDCLAARLLAEEISPLDALYLPQGVLREYGARHAGTHQVLGRPADAWTYERPGKGPSTLYVQTGSRQLLRMVTGEAGVRASIRDFPNLCTRPIPGWVFATDAAGAAVFASDSAGMDNGSSSS
ncbi:MAG: violacein biosynthesis enzyme VioE [Paludibacterium sp.]|uniref:violacein biosynthesis enzyme VioE n=1 Tax=Paludibacterium sp. TaxID=1917523 RepID=UPI0025F64035|nr:violacein biosynthesis enzyme VioE [Paludibacterium sp.]MBV8047728.1 violacein biosynthesis enzyme VioE [Paludibacterium sp.]MBV8648309.1 violacein biosynthesis enzyme VioE [Paludibacterium sp.]